jgi:hypothetical protein
MSTEETSQSKKKLLGTDGSHKIETANDDVLLSFLSGLFGPEYFELGQ